MRKIDFAFLCFFFLTCCSVFGQTTEPERPSKTTQTASADKLYERLGYKASIPLYEGGKIDLKAMMRIANSYRLNHDTENAEKWYAEVVNVSDEAISILHYAQALQSNQKFAQAREQFLRYDGMVAEEGKDQRGRLLATAIDRMNAFRHTEVAIVNVSQVNTERLDFSPAYFKDGIVFVSTRGDVNRVVEQKDTWIDDHFMALYFSKHLSNSEMTTPEEFSYHLTTKYHEGPVTFSKDGRQIFFTRNNYNHGKRRNSRKGVMKLKIYTAAQDVDGWSEAKELPFNTNEYEECHPTLSADGTQLYFSSNRPGGYGGMDLYVTNFEQGTWAEPINLGPQINTSGNEVFPFIHDDATLYFASNGWGGLGGLDVFSSTLNEKEDWHKARNIGTPFNSPKDDFGFILNVLGTEGYLTSARKGGFGQDDIYSFKIPKTMPKEEVLMTFEAKVCAFEEGTDTRLSEVGFSIQEHLLQKDQTLGVSEEDYILKLTPTEKQEEFYLSLKKRLNPDGGTAETTIKEYHTDVNGQFNFEVRKDRSYTLVARKSGYQLGQQEFSLGADFDFTQSIEWCVPLVPQNCPALTGTVVHEHYRNLIPQATITMTSLCTGEMTSLQADAKGAFYFPCVPCDCEFVVTGEKVNFNRDQKALSTLDLDCANAESLTLELELNNNFDGLLSDIHERGQTLEVGTSIELKNIYYDFDESYIRSGAAADLQQVVALLETYPSLILELSSHTDSRGTDAYNLALSQKRAEEAVSYIIRQGIDGRRLVARGYGEKQVRNSCGNYVKCSESEHQYNRRTEVKVLQLGQQEVSVRYLENGPETIDRADPRRQFVWE